MITLVEYPAAVNLRRLLSVRSMLFAALAVLTALVGVAAGVALPLEPIAAIIGALAAVTLLRWLRLAGAVRAVRPLELPLQLGIDIAALTGLLYFTGGWTNPLVSLYLVPIAVASAMLTARLAWTIAVAAVLSYAFIAQFYRPLVPSDDALAGTFTLHVLGMWVTFVVAAALIAYFGTTMAATLRSRAQALASARETNLRNEQIIGVATLAAGTAHELSTPLSSIAVAAGELRDGAQPAQRAEIDLIVDQIDVCKDILRRLRAAATPAHDARTDTQPVGAFIDEVRERFQLLRPTVNARFGCDRAVADARIAADQTLRQAVLNLLNNAADASPLSVECTAHSTDRHLVLDIRDRGNGFEVAGRRVPVRQPARQRRYAGDGNRPDARERHHRAHGRVGAHNRSRRRRRVGSGHAAAEHSDGRFAVTAASSAHEADDGPTLLLADDDPVFRDVLSRALRRRGYAVVTAGDAGSAFDLIAADPPEYAVVDLKMPGASGLELVERLHELEPTTRIVVLTGYASVATAVEAVKLGATHYLSKPASADDVVAALGRARGDSSIDVETPSVERLEWEHIQRVLAEHDGNISATARALKMHRRTLQRKLAKRPVRG